MPIENAKEKLLLGIDIGTSACKVAVFNADGNVLSLVTNEYKVYYPKPGWVEQNPQEWWDSVSEAIKECMSSSKINPDYIAGIGVGGQSWSCIPISKTGEVLHNTPIWMDVRAKDICIRTIDEIGFDRLFNVSGNPFEPTYTTPKILWFKENKPQIYKDTYKFLQSNSYIVYKLTDKITQDTSQGYGLHMFDMKTSTYDTALCDELGIDIEKLPEIFLSHEVVGQVTEKTAQLTGLKKGTLVVAGGLDAACGTLGAGVVKAGQTQEQGGQAGGMSMCLDKALGHPKLILSPHLVPGLWLLQGGTVGGGGTLNWFKKELGEYENNKAIETGRSAFEFMSEEAEKIPVGSDGLVFLPYMAGERSPIWDQNAKGVFFGLSYDKTRAHMIRAMMEGCAFALLHNIETAKEVGVEMSVISAMGGSANSHVWTQIKADVTATPIEVPASDTATTLGAALMAGVGTGVYKDFESAVERTIKVQRRHEPNMKNHKRYKKYYEIYRELYDNLKGTMKKISEI